jgi:hypothetical protein
MPMSTFFPYAFSTASRALSTSALDVISHLNACTLVLVSAESFSAVSEGSEDV